MRRTDLLLTGLTLIAIMLTVGCTQADNLSVEEAWARPGIQDANSAVYFIVSNTTGEADILLSAESDIVTAVELHESTIKTVDEGQGEMVKLMEDEGSEHMEDHHQDCEMEDHEHEGSEDCEDHHEDGDMQDHHEEGELHDDHHADGNMEDHHPEGEPHDDHHGDGDMEDHHEEGELHDDHHMDANMGENTMETSMMAEMEGGVMMMVQQENVPVSAESKVEFKPGGLHVMLIGLKQDLNPGDTITVTLNFEKVGQITLDVPVREP